MVRLSEVGGLGEGANMNLPIAAHGRYVHTGLPLLFGENVEEASTPGPQ